MKKKIIITFIKIISGNEDDARDVVSKCSQSVTFIRSFLSGRASGGAA